MTLTDGMPQTAVSRDRVLSASRSLPWRKMGFVAALYSTQNLSLGFFMFAFLTIAQARGVSLELIGAAAGLALILTLKFLWAPLVDHFGNARVGHYRGWLLVTQSGLALVSASLVLFDPAKDFTTLLAFFALLFTLAATQDVAADAAVTLILTPEERGIGNGFQSAGAAVSQLVGGGLILIVYGYAGWSMAALTLAAFSLIALPFILAWNEPPRGGDAQRAHIGPKEVFGLFRSPKVRRWCFIVTPSYALGFTIAYNLVRPLLVEAGWDETKIGLYVVIAGSALGILGGVAAGALISRIGRRRAIAWLGILQVLATACIIPLALGYTQEWVVFAAVAVGNAGFAALSAVIFTLSMDLTRHETPGSDFTLITTVTSIMMVIAAGSAMAAAGQFGFQTVILVAVLISGIGVILALKTVTPVIGEE